MLSIPTIARRMRGRLGNFKPVLMSVGLMFVGLACDTAASTLTGQVTSVSSSGICINPESKNVEPYCLEVADPLAVANLAEGSCVRSVSTLDDKLIRIEELRRICRLPNR